MQNSFNHLIDSFLENKVGVSNTFLNLELAAQLKENLLALYANEAMITAGIGNNELLTQDKLWRNDKIYWLDRKHQNQTENNFLDLIDAFVLYLNNTCYTGITDYEFHYTLYEKGSFYKKHIDQFRSNKSRVFSMIMYLNNDWKQEDGGELCIHHYAHTQLISPNNGKCVFFKSNEIEHEVLITKQPRLSITGWLKI